MKPITIKLVRLGANVRTIALPDNNIASLKKFVTVQKESCFFRGGEILDDNSLLRDDDTIVYVFPIRGSAIVKRHGIRWKIHKSDMDDQISDFHAHNYDDNEVLDLYTGFLYSPHTKSKKAIIHKKDHKAILLNLSKRKDKEFNIKAKRILADQFSNE